MPQASLSTTPNYDQGPLDRPIPWTRFPDQWGMQKADLSASLRDLAALIPTTLAGTKDKLPFIKLATFGDTTALSPSGRSYRCDANVLAVTGVEVDFDAGDVSPEEAGDRLAAAGLAGGIYTTPSDGEPGKGRRWRALFPLSRPHPPEERARLAARANGALGGIVARESFTLSQAFYFGGIRGRPPVATFLVEGRFLDDADDLDAGAVWKAPLAVTGEAGGEGGALLGLGGDALLDNVREGRELHWSCLAYAKGQAASGTPPATITAALLAALDAWPPTQRDGRWKARRGDVPRIVRDMVKAVAEERGEMHGLLDAAWSPEELSAKRLAAVLVELVGPPEENATVTGQPPATHTLASGSPLGAYALDEDGVIRAFTDRHQGELLFDHHAGAWFRFTGHLWRREETKLAHHYARDLATTLAKRDPRARALNKVAVWEAIERGARTVRAFAVGAEHWDRDPMLLGTPSGVVNLRTGLLRPGRPGDAISKATAVAPVPFDLFDPARDCPRWLAFLDHALGGDADAVRFFQRWSGYNITGETREHALLFIYGPGGSGKSTAVNVLTDLLGDYAIAVATSTLTAKTHEAHPEELARLNGPRMAVASETERGSRWAENRIKEMTGGDRITARFMRQNSFSFAPAFKLSIVGNNAPSLSDVDAAIRRRFLILPFDHPPAVKDDRLADRLREEGPGILAWAIRGALDWQRDGLSRPNLVAQATDAYFAREDTFAAWTQDECEMGEGHEDSAAKLFDSWRHYAHRNGAEPGTQNRAFPERMRREGFEAFRTKAERRYRGIRLKAQDHSAFI